MNANTEITRTPADTLKELKDLVNACEEIQNQSWDLQDILRDIKYLFEKATPIYKEGSTKTKDIVGYQIVIDAKKYQNIKNTSVYGLTSLDNYNQ